MLPKQKTSLSDGSTFDFIIVGGGTAGSVLASRLSEIENFTVLLIEAGDDPPQDSIVPYFKHTLKNSRYDWNFTTVNDGYASQALNNGEQRQPRGKVLGGCGTINDMVYARGFPQDYEEWADFLGPEWNWTTVLEYFKRTEDLVDERIINDPELAQYHGFGGPIRVTGFNETDHTTEKFLEAFAELGFNMVNDMTYPHKIGAGKFSHTIRDGKRDSSVTGFLNKAANRENLFLLKNTLVANIIFENNVAVGIRALKNEEEELHIFAKREVIISAGTFNTPKILLLSGIGPKDHLNTLKIKQIADLPVGKNLHDHVFVPMYLAAKEGTCPQNEPLFFMETIRYMYDRSGSLGKSESLGVYLTGSSSTNENLPDFGIYPTCVPVNNTDFYEGCLTVLGLNDDICDQLVTINKDKELISLVVVLLKPKSRGGVILKSTDPLDYPLIHSASFSNQADLDDYPDIMRRIMYLSETSHFKSLGAKVVELQIEGCDELTGSDKLKCHALSTATAAWHAVGTAAMGSVVCPRFKVFNVTGLRVVDASVIPIIIRANTNSPVVMLAERAADFITEDHNMQNNSI